ncbi:hypothetical protein Tsubulata_048858, partial [Turnera subulata]
FCLYGALKKQCEYYIYCCPPAVELFFSVTSEKNGAKTHPPHLSLAHSLQTDTLKCLDWEDLCRHLSPFTSTSMGHSITQAAAIPIGRTPEESQKLLDQTTAALAVLHSGPFDLSGVEDVTGILDRAVSGTLLTTGELCALRRTLRAARAVREQLMDGGDFSESRVLTTMRGTIGYLAPEWITGEAVTAKADVYSYGMMLFELVSGKRNSEQPKDGGMEYVPVKMASLINNQGDILSLLDPKLEGNVDVEEVTRVCKVACWCIQEDETQRPTMGQKFPLVQNLKIMHTYSQRNEF